VSYHNLIPQLLSCVLRYWFHNILIPVLCIIWIDHFFQFFMIFHNALFKWFNRLFIISISLKCLIQLDIIELDYRTLFIDTFQFIENFKALDAKINLNNSCIKILSNYTCFLAIADLGLNLLPNSKFHAYYIFVLSKVFW